MTERERLIDIISKVIAVKDEDTDDWIEWLASELLENGVIIPQKGKWEIANDSIYENMVDLKCSICGYTDIFESERTVYNYCPECGAKMRKE